MLQPPTDSEASTSSVQVDTPLGDYELVDFGGGRKLERWGDILVECPDRLAQGKPASEQWSADWVYVQELGGGGHWQPTRSGLPREWQVTVNGQQLVCRLDEQGRVGFRGRELACADWICQRIEGCYDLDDIRVLHLFAGGGYVTARALQAGASVVHVDASEDMLQLCREQAGTQHVEYVHDDVVDYVEDLLRRQLRFDVIILPVPPVGHGPKGQMWDREVDMAKLVRYLPRLVSDNCLGVWLSTDGGANAWNAESLGQLLAEVLPGCTIEPLHPGVTARDGRVLPAGVAARWYDETEFLQTGAQPLTAVQLEERLDIHMISMGAAEEPARALAEFSRQQQDFVLHWVSIVTRTSSGMALNFVSYVCPALRLMDAAGVEAWLLACMDIYDTRGLHPAVVAFRDAEGFARDYKARSTGVSFEDVVNVLEVFVHGLNGRRLKLECGDHCYTDTETLFLPACVNRFPDREDNFQLYKALVVHLWAQTWFGSWRIEAREVLGRYADPDAALACFHALETLRLDACIRDTLPGVYRQLLRFRADSPVELNEHWQAAAERLSQPGARVEDTLLWLQRLAGSNIPGSVIYQGVMRPEAVEKVRAARLQADKQAFRMHMLHMQDGLREEADEQDDEAGELNEDGEVRLPFELRTVEADDEANGVTFEMQLDGRPIEPPDDVKGTMASIFQDLGEIPEEYLYAAGDGVYHAEAVEERSVEDVWKGTYHEEGAFLYNEWDYERQNYRKNWTVLRELDVAPVEDDFVGDTLVKYRGLTASLRRTFEALRGEDKMLKKQPYGENVDIDALVEACADTTMGLEMSDRLFTKKHKLERDIAVMFMVDMSGSTKGWINDAERESLVLLCESLETLGDRYAIYGFSGMTRKRCEVYRVKRFDEPYDVTVRGRISGIRPKDYTRMGVTIRHLCHLLKQVEARTKLLITLSDGKPDDYDTYRGAYGIEDTRQALIEARRDGIHSFCITIDTEAKDYLPHMYGAVNYTVIDEVRKLPLKVSDIYRRLTT
ncbi:MAG: methyltransferase domain-containing protein [Gammaproteobacteria bacterium]|nr:methyltransferase domain-containing protein [Gammaproteobacteria bacterium]